MERTYITVTDARMFKAWNHTLTGHTILRPQKTMAIRPVPSAKTTLDKVQPPPPSRGRFLCVCKKILNAKPREKLISNFHCLCNRKFRCPAHFVLHCFQRTPEHSLNVIVGYAISGHLSTKIFHFFTYASATAITLV